MRSASKNRLGSFRTWSGGLKGVSMHMCCHDVADCRLKSALTLAAQLPALTCLRINIDICPLRVSAKSACC